MQGDFHCSRPFGIDDGELDGKSPQECFVLGYETAQLDALIEHPDRIPFSKTIHSDNRARIESNLVRHSRKFKFEWPTDDRSESYLYLTVE